MQVFQYIKLRKELTIRRCCISFAHQSWLVSSPGGWIARKILTLFSVRWDGNLQL